MVEDPFAVFRKFYWIYSHFSRVELEREEQPHADNRC
jgi:hypothetical protein